MTPIHCFGDSHLESLIQTRPDIFVKHAITSKTAYKIGSMITDYFFSRILADIPDGSKVLVSFGEIDCRCHIMRFVRESNRSVAEVASVNISQYKKILDHLQKKYALAVLALYPSYLYPYDPSDVPILHEGTFEEVLEVKRIFNEQLEALCNTLNIVFISLFKECVNQKWYDDPDMLYYRDTTHFGELAVPLIVEKLDKFLGDNVCQNL